MTQPQDSLPETVTLKDGRSLAYAKYGATSDPKTVPVFYFNGTPGSRPECRILDESARKLGIPLIATDRPGFGYSSFQQNRTLLQWPQDILELADQLGIHQFGVIGLSGGGPHALACLHQIPSERLVAATTIAGILPTSFGLTGMMTANRVVLWVTRVSPWLAEKFFAWSMRDIIAQTDKQKTIESVTAMSSRLPQPAVDKECFKRIGEDDVLYDTFIGSVREALRSSCQSFAWEMHLIAVDWGFKVQDLDGSRLTMWHGGLDVNVPVAMSKTASQMLPEARLRVLESEGHISLVVRNNQEILSDMFERLLIKV